MRHYVSGIGTNSKFGVINSIEQLLGTGFDENTIPCFYFSLGNNWVMGYVQLEGSGYTLTFTHREQSDVHVNFESCE